MDNKHKVSDRVHAEATKLGYKELAVKLGISKPAAFKKIKLKQYTVADMDKLFVNTVILS